MKGTYVLRAVVSASTDERGHRIYELECGHRSRVLPSPGGKDSVRSRCHRCVSGSPPPPPPPAPPAPPPPPPPASVPPTTGTSVAVPAISYQVNTKLWRAECPFLAFRPCAHGSSREEAEEKLQKAVASLLNQSSDWLPPGSQFFHVTAP